MPEILTDEDCDLSGSDRFVVEYVAKNSLGDFYLDEFNIEIRCEVNGKPDTAFRIGMVSPAQLMGLIQQVRTALEDRTEELERRTDEASNLEAEELADEIEMQRAGNLQETFSALETER